MMEGRDLVRNKREGTAEALEKTKEREQVMPTNAAGREVGDCLYLAACAGTLPNTGYSRYHNRPLPNQID
jgi:hypothetical protein